jgi:hypothetical protein
MVKKTHSADMGPNKNSTMKCCATGITLLCMGLLFIAAQTAEGKSNEDYPEFDLPSYEVENYRLDITPPVPDKVIVPRFRPSLIGVEVRLTFRIGKDGSVDSISDDVSYYDDGGRYVANAMATTLKSWHFEPALDKSGNPVAVKVALPVIVTKKKGNAHRYASLSLKEPVILAVLDR